MSSKKRVEPSEPPGKLAGWLLVDKLVVVGSLVQGLQEDVGWVGEVVDVLQLTQSLSLFKKYNWGASDTN